MANRWGNSGNSGRLYFGGLQITEDGDHSHEIKIHLLLARKLMTKLCLSCYAMLSQSCLTLCDPMNCSPPDFSVHGDSPSKNTGVGCYASSRRSSQSRDQTQVSHNASRSLPSEPPGKPMSILDSILKSRNITLPAKVHLVKAMVFP